MTWAWQPLLPAAAQSAGPAVITAGLCEVNVTTLSAEIPGPPQAVPPRVTRGLIVVEGLYRGWWPWYRAVSHPEIPLSGAGPVVLTAGLATVDVGTLAASLAGAGTAATAAPLATVSVATLSLTLLGDGTAAFAAPLAGVDVGTLAPTLTTGAGAVLAGLSQVDVAALTVSLGASGTAAVAAPVATVTVATLPPTLTGAGVIAAGLGQVNVVTLGATVTGDGTATLSAPAAAVTVATLPATLTVVGAPSVGGSGDTPARGRRRAAPAKKKLAPVVVLLPRRTVYAGLATVTVDTLTARLRSGLAVRPMAVVEVRVATLPAVLWQDDVDEIMQWILSQEVGV